MKTLTTISLFALLALVPAAFADHPTATVTMPEGTGVPGCQETNECFVPADVSVDVGGEVTWVNEDSVIHTVAAGDLKEDNAAVGFDYPNGFDSGLIGAKGSPTGDTYTVTDLKEGTYPYFCTVHPWMTGVLYVTGSHGGDMESGSMETGGSDMMMDDKKGMMMEDGDKDAMGMTEDKGMMMEDGKMMEGMMDAKIPGSLDEVMVAIETQGGDMGSPLQIDVKFTDADGGDLSHVNYRVTAVQGGQTVADDGSPGSPAHSHTGSATHNTSPLRADASDTPVDVSVYLYGFGVGDITGPSGDVASYQVVPEFGAVAVAVLGVAIVSIIAITARTRLVPRI